MRRALLVGTGTAVVVIAALDLRSRLVLGRDLIALARSREVAPVVDTAAPVTSDGPLLTTVESPRYTIMAMVASECARGPACKITLTIEPAPGRTLVADGPYAFLPTANAAFAYDAPPGKIRAKERTPVRALIDVPARMLAAAKDLPATLEGKLRVITCDAETCTSEIAPIAIALPTRAPSG